MDITLPRVSKLSAVKWIISQHSTAANEVKDPSIHGGSVESDDASFLFMGDDTNDIEIASQAKYAFIANPCSESMSQWLSKQREDNTNVNGDLHLKQAKKFQLVTRDIDVVSDRVYHANKEHHAGTEALLAQMLHILEHDTTSD